LLVAGYITRTCALLLDVVAGLTAGDVSPTAFGLFGAATVLLAHRWILVDVRNGVQESGRATPRGAGRLSASHCSDCAYLSRALARGAFIQLNPEVIDDVTYQRSNRYLSACTAGDRRVFRG
jgi:hypothetical protein